MAGKRNEIELAKDRARVAELMHRGTTSPSELMDLINQGRPKNKHVSRQTIANDIEWLKEQYRESAMYDFNEAWHQTLAQYNDLLKVAWAEFYASKTVKVTVTTEGRDEAASDAEEFDDVMGTTDQPVKSEAEKFDDKMQAHGAGEILSAEDLLAEARTMKSIIKKEQREGNVAYLQLIEKVIEKIAKMKAVDGTSKIALTNSKGEDLPSVTEGILSTLKRISKPIDEEFLEGELVETALLTGGNDADTDDAS